MAQFQNYVCDGCGKIVYGKEGAAFVGRDYFQIKGQLLLELFPDKSPHNRVFVYATKAPGEELTFCLKEGLPCLQSFMQSRKDLHFKKRASFLRDEAERDFRDRDSGLYDDRR